MRDDEKELLLKLKALKSLGSNPEEIPDFKNIKDSSSEDTESLNSLYPSMNVPIDPIENEISKIKPVIPSGYDPEKGYHNSPKEEAAWIARYKKVQELMKKRKK
jgi:hypothetical protein